MKKVTYALILPLVVAGGLVFANREMNHETAKKPAPRLPTAAEIAAERKKWEASPDGIRFKQWQESPAGKKVYASIANIRKNISGFTNMEAIITSLSLPPRSRLGFGVMARINGADYIVKFDANESQLEQLQGLKVNDKIIIRSHNVSPAPKYAYPIISTGYAEQAGREIFKCIHPKGGC
jgi:hypothetical protein